VAPRPTNNTLHTNYDYTRTQPARFSSHETISKLASSVPNSVNAESRKPTSLWYKRERTRFRMFRGPYATCWCIIRMGGLIRSYLRRPMSARRVVRVGVMGRRWGRLRIGSCLGHRFVHSYHSAYAEYRPTLTSFVFCTRRKGHQSHW